MHYSKKSSYCIKKKRGSNLESSGFHVRCITDQFVNRIPFPYGYIQMHFSQQIGGNNLSLMKTTKIYAKIWKQPKCLSVDGWIKKIYNTVT